MFGKGKRKQVTEREAEGETERVYHEIKQCFRGYRQLNDASVLQLRTCGIILSCIPLLLSTAAIASLQRSSAIQSGSTSASLSATATWKKSWPFVGWS